MKRKHNEGFSLTEVLVAMAILTAIVIPVCTSLTVCAKMDARAEATLRARIAVSSAVQQLTAEGIDAGQVQDGDYSLENLPVKITAVPQPTADAPVYYNVSVCDEDELVTVHTCIRVAPPAKSEEQEGGGGQ